MNKLKNILIAGLVASALSYGQAGGPPPRGGFGPRGAFGPLGGIGGHPGKVVTGAPYSATMTNQATQTLADGNTISRSNTAQLARDSYGRTYEQQTITGGPLAESGPTTVTFISDPVAGYSYVLNANKKVATRRAIPTAPAAGSHTGSTPRMRPPGADAANRAETDLGSQMVNGVTASGKMVTNTVPAGTMGNAQAIVSTNETWFSPDLQVVVLAKRNDPLRGQSIYSLTNIQRAEPPAALFQVPSDYTVQDAPRRPNMQSGPFPQPQH